MMPVTRALLTALAVVAAGGMSCQTNRPPDVPAVPTGPHICFKDTTYTFSTIATDPDGDSVKVRLSWTESLVSGWSAWMASGDTVALTNAWHDTGTYEVRAQAVDGKLRVSVWSRPLTVQVVLRRPPDAPDEPVGPDKGGRDTTYTFAVAAFHPDSITVSIRFSWGDGDTSDWSAFVASGESVRTSHIWSTPDTCSVRAQARDTGNALSHWSDSHRLIIRPPDTLRKWRFGSAADMYSSPAIGPDGTVFFGSYDSCLYAVNPSGTLKWRYQTGGSVQASPALAADGTIHFWSRDNYLYSLNPDGTFKWRYWLGSIVTSSPAVAADGTVYVGSFDDFLRAFNPDSTLKWFYSTSGSIHSSPAIAADGTVYAGSGDFYALNPDGTLKWRYDIGGGGRTSPAIAADGTVYVGSSDECMYALNPDGTLKWQYETDADVTSSPAVGTDGAIYFGSHDDYFYAVNPDGTLRWRYRTQGPVSSSPAIASDGTVYFGSNDNCLYALYPDGTLKWQYESGGDIESSPTIGTDGTVYFVSRDGYLYALKGTSPLADSPWPKFHHDLKNSGRTSGGK